MRPDSQLSGYRTDKDLNFQSVNVKKKIACGEEGSPHPAQNPLTHPPSPPPPPPKKKQAERKPRANPGMGMILCLQLSTFQLEITVN